MAYITVFTPVYNRAHTLDRLYNSLLKQKYTDFEWVVVDDGSIDESIEKIENYMNNDNSFNIILVKNNHGGKHRAVNAGLNVANGKLFLMLDSDDWLTENALDTIFKWEKRIPIGSKCAGLCGCMADPEGHLISKGLKKDFIFMPLTEMIKKGITGDHADILFTEIFKQYPFPEYENEYHIAPGVPFIRMANDGYNLLFFNEVIYIAEYGPDGLTAMGDKKSLDNFRGYTLRTRELIHSNVGIKRRCTVLLKYCYLANKKKKNISEISTSLQITPTIVIPAFWISLCYSFLKNKNI